MRIRPVLRNAFWVVVGILAIAQAGTLLLFAYVMSTEPIPVPASVQQQVRDTHD